jgi:hypothetical protein
MLRFVLGSFIRSYAEAFWAPCYTSSMARSVLRRRQPRRRLLASVVLLTLAAAAFWLYASLTEFATGRRLLPWSAYAFCGQSDPGALPATVRVGLYEEFPNPWRLAKLRQIDFPVTLAVAARSRDEFTRLRETILRTYPQVRDVYFWPLLEQEEGYYPGTWSKPEGIRRISAEATDLPLLWDLEMPRGISDLRALSFGQWWENRALLDTLFARHQAPVHVWRTHTSMGLDPLFLRLIGMHADPHDYQSVRLHLDLYTTGSGQEAGELARVLRCGVERYGERFIPSLGVLNDNEGPPEVFVPTATLRRNLEIARAAGASEVWLFGVNGLDQENLAALRETLPLERLTADEGGAHEP